MENITSAFLDDKKRLLKFIEDFGDKDIYDWSRTVLDTLFKKIYVLNDVCLTGKVLSGLHNIYYYFKKFREDSDCLYHLVISLYIIGLQSGALKLKNKVESFEFFHEYISKEDWAAISEDLSILNNFDMQQLSRLHQEWWNDCELTLSPIGVQTSCTLSIYLGYKY